MAGAYTRPAGPAVFVPVGRSLRGLLSATASRISALWTAFLYLGATSRMCRALSELTDEQLASIGVERKDIRRHVESLFENEKSGRR
ncbi:MAG: hypothetical protein OXI81_08025 [Paracoccaceae bacterium]|nr:hypothetical protein [Paracoccaceae bacterium]MDE2911446.1 hypothetical protein [Paracoccaceae bacterium]